MGLRDRPAATTSITILAKEATLTWLRLVVHRRAMTETLPMALEARLWTSMAHSDAVAGVHHRRRAAFDCPASMASSAILTKKTPLAPRLLVGHGAVVHEAVALALEARLQAAGRRHGNRGRHHRRCDGAGRRLHPVAAVACRHGCGGRHHRRCGGAGRQLHRIARRHHGLRHHRGATRYRASASARAAVLAEEAPVVRAPVVLHGALVAEAQTLAFEARLQISAANRARWGTSTHVVSAKSLYIVPEEGAHLTHGQASTDSKATGWESERERAL